MALPFFPGSEAILRLKGLWPLSGDNLNNIGGLSGITFGMSGEVEKARLDILERMKRTTDSRAKSRLTLPKLLGDGTTEKNILADVL